MVNLFFIYLDKMFSFWTLKGNVITYTLPEKNKIKLDISVDGEVDWCNTELVWREEGDGSVNLEDNWVMEPRNTSNLYIEYQWQD